MNSISLGSYKGQDINTANVYQILDRAVLFDSPDLQKKCIQVINRNWDVLKTRPELESLSRAALCAFLADYKLDIRETDIVTFVRRWAQANCKRQDKAVNPANERYVLGPALYLLRFPTMTAWEVAEVAATGILTDDEASEVFHAIALETPSNMFPSKIRRSMIRVPRFETLQATEVNYDNFELVKFKVDQNCHLKGVGLFGANGASAEHEVRLKVRVEGHSFVTLGTRKTTIHADGSDKILDVFFKTPVPLYKDGEYVVGVTLTGPPTYLGTDRLELSSACGITCHFEGMKCRGVARNF